MSKLLLGRNKKYEDSLIINKYDAENSESARSWVENTKKAFGSIDTIIHCAGIFKNTGLIFSNVSRTSG